MNIENAINEASLILKKNKIKSPKLDSEILLSETIKKDRRYIILNHQKKIEEKIFNNFITLIKQRAYGKPIAYLTGKKSFWNYEFEITEGILVPRPDTEIIVEEVLRLSKNRSKLRVLEIGVGSGCILLTILDEKKGFNGIGIDISKKCIDLCKRNALGIGVKERVKLFKSNVDNFNYGKYDLVISNPPYIEQASLKNLDKDVVNFEPRIALNGGIDGLSEIRKVINKSTELIKINGKLILEIGFNQKEEVKKILKNKGFYINKVLKDYAGKDRCIVSTKNN